MHTLTKNKKKSHVQPFIIIYKDYYHFFIIIKICLFKGIIRKQFLPIKNGLASYNLQLTTTLRWKLECHCKTCCEGYGLLGNVLHAMHLKEAHLN